ncbi:hypothetical protein NC652_030248 [Populus alba x Populus x berolinensis]|nr:hypothetical protein NC652_030248 [Populus alba x Populus x berolinensis]
MKGNQYGNDSNYWDSLESRLFERFLADTDRSSDSSRHYGTYSQYESYEDDGNIASYYRGSYESRNQGQHSGLAAGGSWPDNEVMARQLQEMSIYGEDSGSTASENHQLLFNLYLVIAYHLWLTMGKVLFLTL